MDGRRRTDGAGLADALGPERVAGAVGLRVGHLEAAQLGGRRHRVVREVGRDGVAVGVVLHPLVQRLRRALCNATVLLAGDEQRVQDATTVVDRDVAQHLDVARLGVDLDDGHMCTERERRVAAVEVELVP